MRITLEVDDAVRMADCLNCSGERLCAKEISRRTGVSLRFALKILRKLCAAQIMRSYQGVEGGYELNRKANQISLLEIIESIDGRISLTRCVETDVCSKNRNTTSRCKFYRLYSNLSDSIREKLAMITLDQISGLGRPEEAEGNLRDAFESVAVDSGKISNK